MSIQFVFCHCCCNTQDEWDVLRIIDFTLWEKILWLFRSDDINNLWWCFSHHFKKLSVVSLNVKWKTKRLIKSVKSAWFQTVFMNSAREKQCKRLSSWGFWHSVFFKFFMGFGLLCLKIVKTVKGFLWLKTHSFLINCFDELLLL